MIAARMLRPGSLAAGLLAAAALCVLADYGRC